MPWSELSANIAAEVRDHPHDFLRQPTIEKTLHPNAGKLARAYWLELSASDYFVSEILPAAIDDPLGKPHRFEWFPRLSPQSIQHAYYIHLLYERMSVKVADVRSIVEVGGGYGNFARIAFEMGFRGRYQLCDLPEMHCLQRLFLGDRVHYSELPQITPGDLLVATFSISEFPAAQRDWMELRYGTYKYIILSTNREWLGIDNVGYFRSLQKKIGGEFFKDPHRNAWFLLCEN